MYLNPETSKSWTPEEEAAFAKIMMTGDLERLPAIRLWKRCNKDLGKALPLAEQTYAPAPAQIDRNRTNAARFAGWHAQAVQTPALDGVV